MNKKLFIMNKKLLMGLGSALILSTPILVATSCGDSGVKVSGYQLIKDQTDTNKITIRINGQNLSTKSEDWEITESNNGPVYNVWNFDTTKSNSNSVYFSATKDDTKGKTYTFSCNGTNMVSNFSTPWPPTSISPTNGLNAFKGYQGTNKNPESSNQNKANISITDLTVNFEFKNVSQNSLQFMKLILPSQLGDVFENYQGYNSHISIKWSLKKDANNSDFEFTNNNTLISTKAIDPTTIQNVTLVGLINMNGWEDTFEINVNFSNEAKDIQINSVTSKIEQDKVVVTVRGSKLPTDFSNWKFKENDNTVSSEWSLSTSPSATETQVTFEATYANVIGKTFTIEGTGAESTASKSFTVPVSTISNIKSEMTDEGDLKLIVTGTNLSSTKSLYVFNFVEAAPSTYTNANPSIDVNKIDLTWTNSSQIVFTIKKQNDQGQTLTKDLYGAKFSLQIQNQTPATEFTFSDYVAPTAIIKDRFFTNVQEGTSSSSINTQVTSNKITGDNLAYTITTSSADNKFVSISLPKSDNGSTNIFNFLSGQKGFTTSGNNTTLTWSIPTDQATNWDYDQSTSTLKNRTELTTDTNPTIAVTGTITDTITSRSKTFTLNLTLVLFNSNSVINDPTISWVSEVGSSDKGKKIKVTFTGSGLSTNQGDWTITPKDSSSSLPNWTIDQTSSATSVSFTIEFNKDTIGKSYTFSVNGIQGTKDVTIPISTITDVNSSISTNGDLILTFTGDNLSANLDTYIFTFKPIVNTPPKTTFDGAANNSPATPPTPVINDEFKKNIDVDWTSDKSITLTIKKIRGNGSQTAITKGLYGLWYEVNVINQPEAKKEFKFEDYVAPTSIQSSKFFEIADSYSQKPEASSQPSDDSHLTSEYIKQDDENKPFDWTITSHYKSHKYIYLVLPSDDVILTSVEGWKGFSENQTSSPDENPRRSLENNNTSVSWKFKDRGTDNAKFELSGNGSNILYNKEDLTENNPISAELTATITDNLTDESVTFDIKITFKLGDLEEPPVKGTAALSENNTKVKVTITGTNLPTKNAKWKIEENNSTVSSQQAEGGGGTSNSNTWTINASASSSTSIEFSAKYSDVAGKKYKFSLVDKPEVTTTVTCPAPKFTNPKVEGQFANKYNIEFTLSGTNLPNDINMYKFGTVTVDNQQVSLDNLEKTFNFVNESQVKITFNKYKNNQSVDSGNKYKNSESADSRTLQTKGLYGKEVSIWFSNETESNTNKISFPNYYVNGMKKELLGTISTGASSSNLTPQQNLEINIGTISNNEYPVTITTDSDAAKFIKFQLPSHSIDPSAPGATGSAKRPNLSENVNFLETGFDSWGGFSSSILTSLKWSIPTQTTSPTNGSVSGDVTKEGNDVTSTGTSGWTLTNNELTNSTELTTEGLNVVLTATLTDSETGETVSFNVKLTVKLGTSSSTGTGSGGTTPGGTTL